MPKILQNFEKEKLLKIGDFENELKNTNFEEN